MSKANFRVKTWLDKDERGHFCVMGVWIREDVGVAGDGAGDPDHEFWIGPFESCKHAKYELKHGVRKVVSDILKKLKEDGGKLESFAQGDL